MLYSHRIMMQLIILRTISWISQMVNGYEVVYRQIIKDRIESNGRIHATKINF